MPYSNLIRMTQGSPSTSLEEINARQSLVSKLLESHPLRADVIEALKQSDDLSRITQRFSLGRGDADDLNAVRQTINMWSSLQAVVRLHEDETDLPDLILKRKSDQLSRLLDNMVELQHLADRIRDSVVNTPPRRTGAVEGFDTGFEPALDSSTEDPSKWTITPKYDLSMVHFH